MSKAKKVAAPKAVKKSVTKKATPVKKSSKISKEPIAVKPEKPKKVYTEQISFLHLDCILTRNISVKVALKGNEDVLILSLVEAMKEDIKVANVVLKAATDFVKDKLNQVVIKATEKKSKSKK